MDSLHEKMACFSVSTTPKRYKLTTLGKAKTNENNVELAQFLLCCGNFGNTREEMLVSLYHTKTIQPNDGSWQITIEQHERIARDIDDYIYLALQKGWIVEL